MKRMHVHVGIDDLAQSVRFYSALFGTEPAVMKDDYAKWMLDDPRVNFAISTRGAVGLDHLGIQAESTDELAEIRARMQAADRPLLDQGEAACCYARSDKTWTDDPAGIAWEAFLTVGEITAYGEDSTTGIRLKKALPPAAASCCTPDPAPKSAAACCGSAD